MRGREENSIKTERGISNRLEKFPEIIRKYSETMSNKTPQTKRVYLGYINEFLSWLSSKGIDVNDPTDYIKIKASDINSYLKFIMYSVDGRVKCSKNTAATKLFAVSSFFDFLVADDYLAKNPCKVDTVSIPKDKKEKELIYLTSEEIEVIKKNIVHGVGSKQAKSRQKEWRSRDLAIFILACSTGLRVTALSEINLKDLDISNNTIYGITEKGDVTKTVYFGETAKKYLEMWITDREFLMSGFDENEALFISRNRTRITSKSIGNIIKKYSEGIDKHITPHKLRSTCANNLYKQTGDIHLVASVLGHKNIKNTMIYARNSEEQKKDAAKMIDLFI